MGIFDLFKGADINAGVEQFRSTPGAFLLDVRSEDEYKGGHIPGSMNTPTQVVVNKIQTLIKNKNAPVFVYCLSGARSKRAAALMENMGYTNVTNIGGISDYKGAMER